MSVESIINLHVDKTFSSSIVLIVEASEEIWKEIHDTASKLVQRYPGVFRRLFFLGNIHCGHISGSTKIAELLTSLFTQNKNRISLIGPIYEILEKEKFNGQIAVVCNQEPVDIADWYNTEILNRSLFISLQELSTEHDISQVLPTGDISEKLRNPVQEVLIKGKGFLPIRWGMPLDMYGTVEIEDGSFCIRISPERDTLELHLQALTLNNELPQLFLNRVRGTTAESIKFKEEKSPWFDMITWQPIPDNLIPIIDAKRIGSSFTCPKCGNEHGCETHFCPSGGSVFSGMTQNTCLLFNKNKYLDLSKVYAFPLPRSEKIISNQGEVYLMGSEGWNLVHSINCFEEVASDVSAVLNSI